MFSKLLLVLGIAFGYGSNLTLETPQKSYDIVYDYDSSNNDNFYYYASLFPEWSVNWLNNATMVITATIQTSDLLEMPDKVFDYFYLGSFGVDYEFSSLCFSMPYVQSFYLDSPLNISFPFIKSDNNVLYDKTLFPEVLFVYQITVYFGYNIETNARVYAEYGFIYEVAFTNELGIANYYTDLQDVAYNDGYTDGYNEGANDFYDDGYDNGYNDGYSDGELYGFTDGYYEGLQDGYQIGFSDAEYVGDGTWLGNLVFGTIGGIVGFLFALSDFEVLGVSIMSIITLFVAIGIVRLLLKVLR